MTTTHHRTEHLPAASARTIRIHIRRCDGPGKPSRWDAFDLMVTPGMNIISCLQQIAAKPVTVDGSRVTPPVWDSGCLEEVCGACTMVINGRVRQSCSTLLDTIAPNQGDEVILEPMSKFPVVRDLWVDRSRLFNDLSRIKAWVPIDGLYALGPGPRETPEVQEARYTMSTCMSCGCCLEACPQYTRESDPAGREGAFVGAAVISQARYFNDHETGKNLASDRLDVLSEPGGVSECGNAQNCVEVCPKQIPLTESIAAVGRAVSWHNIRKFFAGR